MEQKIDINHGPVTQSGDVLVCNGAQVCPLHAANEPESKRQSEFAQRTKIWCPPGAREILEDLMARHHFVAPRLHTAWQANSLTWNIADSKLVAKTHWLEPVFGYLLVGFMLFYFLVMGAALLFESGLSPLQTIGAFLVTMVVYLGMMLMAIRFVILPYRIARRAKPFLESIYAEAAPKKPDGS